MYSRPSILEAENAIKIGELEMRIQQMNEKLTAHNGMLYDTAWRDSIDQKLEHVSNQLEQILSVGINDKGSLFLRSLQRLIQNDAHVNKVVNDMKTVQINSKRHDERISKNEQLISRVHELEKEMSQFISKHDTYFCNTEENMTDSFHSQSIGVDSVKLSPFNRIFTQLFQEIDKLNDTIRCQNLMLDQAKSSMETLTRQVSKNDMKGGKGVGSHFKAMKLEHRTEAMLAKAAHLPDAMRLEARIEDIATQLTAVSADTFTVWKQGRLSVVLLGCRTLKSIFSRSRFKVKKSCFMIWRGVALLKTKRLATVKEGIKRIVSVTAHYRLRTAIILWRVRVKDRDRLRSAALEWLAERRKAWDMRHYLKLWHLTTRVEQFCQCITPNESNVSGSKTINESLKLSRRGLDERATIALEAEFPAHVPLLSLRNLQGLLECGGSIKDCVVVLATYAKGLGKLLAKTVQADQLIQQTLANVIKAVEASSSFNETKTIERIGVLECEVKENKMLLGCMQQRSSDELARVSEAVARTAENARTLVDNMMAEMDVLKKGRGVDIDKVERLMLLQGELLTRCSSIDHHYVTMEATSEDILEQMGKCSTLAKTAIEKANNAKSQMDEYSLFYYGQAKTAEDKEGLYETALNRLAADHTALQQVIHERSEQVTLRLALLEKDGVTPTMLADLFLQMTEKIMQSSLNMEVALAKFMAGPDGKALASLVHRIAEKLSSEAVTSALQAVMAMNRPSSAPYDNGLSTAKDFAASLNNTTSAVSSKQLRKSTFGDQGIRSAMSGAAASVTTAMQLDKDNSAKPAGGAALVSAPAQDSVIDSALLEQQIQQQKVASLQKFYQQFIECVAERRNTRERKSNEEVKLFLLRKFTYMLEIALFPIISQERSSCTTILQQRPMTTPLPLSTATSTTMQNPLEKAAASSKRPPMMRMSSDSALGRRGLVQSLGSSAMQLNNRSVTRGIVGSGGGGGGGGGKFQSLSNLAVDGVQVNTQQAQTLPPSRRASSIDVTKQSNLGQSLQDSLKIINATANASPIATAATAAKQKSGNIAINFANTVAGQSISSSKSERAHDVRGVGYAFTSSPSESSSPYFDRQNSMMSSLDLSAVDAQDGLMGCVDGPWTGDGGVGAGAEFTMSSTGAPPVRRPSGFIQESAHSPSKLQSKSQRSLKPIIEVL